MEATSGMSRSHSALAKHYWWPGMRADILKWCRACLTCATHWIGHQEKPPLVPSPVAGPFDRLELTFFSSRCHTRGTGCLCGLSNKVARGVPRQGSDSTNNCPVAGGTHHWDTRLLYVLFAYQASLQESTRESPFFLLYGRDPTLPTEAALNSPVFRSYVDTDDYKTELTQGLTEVNRSRRHRRASRRCMT